MAERSEISWTDATLNPWWGCSKVSPACDHCYAERDAARFAPGRTLWGVGAERREFGDAHWNEPRRWAKTLPAKLGRRPRVFCASMADVFDKDAPDGARARLFALIADTPELDWLLLTKRIGNAQRMLDDAMLALSRGSFGWTAESALPNVWLGATVIDQAEADRDIPKLLAVPARVRFLSIEPMLGPIDIRGRLAKLYRDADGPRFGIDWVIAGGESGPHARPAHPDWFRTLRDQCAAAGVPFHFKQWGEWAPHDGSPGADLGGQMRRGTAQLLHAVGNPEGFFRRGDAFVVRLGKRAAGRLLDGVEHNGFPA